MTEKTRKIIDKAFSIIWWAILLSIFVLVSGIVVAKAKGEVPKVFGYSVMKITTPSMGETIPVGTYILVKEVSPEQVKINDVICFYSEDARIYGYPNTHRVVEEPIKVGDKYEYVTKGDATSIADSVTAKSDKLIGKYVKTMDLATWISNFATSKGSFAMLAVMLISTAGIIVTIVIIKSKNETEQ